MTIDDKIGHLKKEKWINWTPKKRAMSKQNKEGMLNVRLQQQHKDLLKGLAAQQKISTSAYIRQLINSFALPTE